MLCTYITPVKLLLLTNGYQTR